MVQKYVFIDRDGVINKDGGGWTEYGYITKWEDFYFLPGVLEAITELTNAGYKNIIISNQRCVGRGIITEDKLNEITNNYISSAREHGGDIAKVFYCLHLDEDNCDCRKPKEGLFIKAKKELDINSFEGKFFIGDSAGDMQAGQAVGLKTILVLSGKSTREDAEKWEYKPDHIFDGLLSAARFIIGKD